MDGQTTGEDARNVRHASASFDDVYRAALTRSFSLAVLRAAFALAICRRSPPYRDVWHGETTYTHARAMFVECDSTLILPLHMLLDHRLAACATSDSVSSYYSHSSVHRASVRIYVDNVHAQGCDADRRWYACVITNSRSPFFLFHFRPLSSSVW